MKLQDEEVPYSEIADQILGVDGVMCCGLLPDGMVSEVLIVGPDGPQTLRKVCSSICFPKDHAVHPPVPKVMHRCVAVLCRTGWWLRKAHEGSWAYRSPFRGRDLYWQLSRRNASLSSRALAATADHSASGSQSGFKSLAIGSHRRLETHPKHKQTPLHIMNAVAMQTGCPQRCAGPPHPRTPGVLTCSQMLVLLLRQDQMHMFVTGCLPMSRRIAFAGKPVQSAGACLLAAVSRTTIPTPRRLASRPPLVYIDRAFRIDYSDRALFALCSATSPRQV